MLVIFAYYFYYVLYDVNISMTGGLPKHWFLKTALSGSPAIPPALVEGKGLYHNARF